MRLRTATGLIAWCLRRSGRWGATLPPWGVFMLPEHITDADLLAHETVHWRQAQELGAFKFYATYLWLLLRHGYWKHPMEMEAREQ